MPDDVIQLSFHIFNPSTVRPDDAKKIGALSDREEFQALAQLVTDFRVQMTQKMITTPAPQNESLRGAVLALQDVETVMARAKDLAFIREVHEAKKGQSHAKWSNL